MTARTSPGSSSSCGPGRSRENSKPRSAPSPAVAASTRTRRPPERVPSAASSSPWTVRARSWSWNPAKSVPSYSTRARIRTRAPSRAPWSGSEELDLDDRGPVTVPVAEMGDPGIPGCPLGVFRGNLIEELLDDKGLVRELGHHGSSGGEVTPLGERDHPLHLGADLLGLRLGGHHLLVAEDRHDQVPVEREPRALQAAELPTADLVAHRSDLLGLVGERLVAVVVHPAKLGRIRLGDEEAPHPESLLHLVERLLSEVAHPQQVVVGQLQELAHLDTVVALQRVVGPHPVSYTHLRA